MPLAARSGVQETFGGSVEMRIASRIGRHKVAKLQIKNHFLATDTDWPLLLPLSVQCLTLSFILL